MVLLIKNLMTGKYGGSPIQVKRSSGVGVNTIKNLMATMYDMDVKKGFVVALSFGSGAKEHVAKLKNRGDYEIILLTHEDIIDGYNYE